MKKYVFMALFCVFSFFGFAQSRATNKIEVTSVAFQPNLKYHFFTQLAVDYTRPNLIYELPTLDFAIRYTRQKSHWQVLGGLIFRMNQIGFDGTTYLDRVYGFVRPKASGLPPRYITSYFGGLSIGVGYSPTIFRNEFSEFRLTSQLFANGFKRFAVNDNVVHNPDIGITFPVTDDAPNEFYVESQLNIGFEIVITKNQRPDFSFGMFVPFAIGYKPDSDVNPIRNIGFLGFTFGKYF